MPQPLHQAAATSPSETVLVVDDSRLQRRILASSLRKWNYNVLEAASGEEALAICRVTPPDLVLSDWVMPGMDGLEFCKAFRDVSEDHYGYFILLTSKSESNDVALGLDSGADDFLSKPVNSDELRARMTAGERIIKMQRQLSDRNRAITDAHDELQRVYDAIDKDLLEAKKLQQSLLPVRHQRFDQADLSLLLRSSGHVGGDLVGFFQVDQTQLCLFGIDVSGHGISSALMTARLAGYLSASAPDQNIALARQADGSYVARPPHEVIQEMNNLVLTEMETEHYFTMILALVDLTTGHITISQAGHPHPAIQRANGEITQEGLGGFPVGLLGDVSFDTYEVVLAPGDRIALLSDGVTECPHPSGGMLGEEGLAALMAQLANSKGTAFLEALAWQLTDYSESADLADDVSGILFEFHGADAK